MLDRMRESRLARLGAAVALLWMAIVVAWATATAFPDYAIYESPLIWLLLLGLPLGLGAVTACFWLLRAKEVYTFCAIASAVAAGTLGYQMYADAQTEGRRIEALKASSEALERERGGDIWRAYADSCAPRCVSGSAGCMEACVVDKRDACLTQCKARTSGKACDYFCSADL